MYMARNIRGTGEREDGVNAAFFICPLSARTCISHTRVMLLMMLVEDADVSFHQHHMTNDVPDEVGSMYTSEKQKVCVIKRVLFPLIKKPFPRPAASSSPSSAPVSGD